MVSRLRRCHGFPGSVLHKGVLVLLVMALLRAEALAGTGDTNWMVKAKYGLFVHYQYRILLGYSVATKPQFPTPSQMTADQWNRFVEGFDVHGFASQVAETQVGWVIFCIDDHYFAWPCPPNEAFDKCTGFALGEKCARRDLLRELADALNAKGVRLIHGLGDANQFSDQELIDWTNICNCQGGVCTLAWPLDPRTGLIKDFGFAQLKRIARGQGRRTGPKIAHAPEHFCPEYPQQPGSVRKGRRSNMSTRVTRRELLRRSAVVAAAAGTPAFGVPAVLAQRAPNSKLGVAIIGAGGRGGAHLGVALSEQLVALVDIDDNRMAGILKSLETNPAASRSKVKSFSDFRKMLDECHQQIDVVFVATPENTHAVASMMAIKLGKHVYCEKPLTHDIYEARALGEAARQYKVMTQMGNQGHAGEGIRVLREYLEAGAIGTVLETHTWQDQVYGGRTRGQEKPVSTGVHWDEWIGPGAWTGYRDGLHPSPGWYQWMDYGTGLLACVGAHTFDAVHWGLQLKYPTSCVALEREGDTPGVWGTLNTLVYEFPRPSLPPLKAYWYDGLRRDPNAKDQDGRPYPKGINRPRLADELSEKYGRNLTGGGTIFVGEKGYMHSGVMSDSPRIVPEEKHKEFPAPAKKYPRTHGIHADFLRACKDGGDPPSSNFPEVSGPYMEALLVGNLAMRAGIGRKVQWDGVNMKCTNLPELNQFVKRECRQGWTL